MVNTHFLAVGTVVEVVDVGEPNQVEDIGCRGTVLQVRRNSDGEIIYTLGFMADGDIGGLYPAAWLTPTGAQARGLSVRRSSRSGTSTRVSQDGAVLGTHAFEVLEEAVDDEEAAENGAVDGGGKPRIEPNRSGMLDATRLVATIDGAEVGEVIVLVEDRGTYCGVAWALRVDEAHRNKGIGTRLMQQAERWAMGQGAEVMELGAEVGDAAALSFHRRLGYQVVASRGPSWSYRSITDPSGDAGATEYVLSRWLPAE